VLEPAFSVSTFVARGCLGNPHAVFLHETAERIRRWSTVNTLFIAILLTQDGEGKLHARFFQNAREIRRCGSGNLAVAAVADRLQWYQKSYRKTLTLHTACETLTLQKKAAGYYVYLARPLSQRPLLSFDFWQRLLKLPCIDGCAVGTAQDYAILEVKNWRQLANLRPDFAKLKRFSRRALIVTAREKNLSRYFLRYFAPQYGNDEDQATGSANIQLLRYWRKRGLYGQLVGRQLSTAGGAFCGIDKNRWVEIGGKAIIHPGK